jgi:uncharacterized membrane protein
MGTAKTIFAGIGAGAALMYILDPDRGRRRRALVRDRFSRGIHTSREGLGKTWRDLENRAHGLASGARAMVRSSDTDADVLEARVRSKIGRVVSHPHAIRVWAMEEGRIVLEGLVLAHESEDLISTVRSVPGVREVEDRLERHETAEGIPDLQGGGTRQGERWELMQSNWTPAVRMLVGVAGGALAVGGLARGGVVGWAQSLAGGGLLLRCFTNKEFRRMLGLDHEHGLVDIQKTLHILAPVEEVYRFWTNYQNFPRFMSHLREVRDLGNGRSHWTAAGPAGVPVSWDAEITEQIPNKILAWRSVPGSRVDSAGVVRFDTEADGSTRLSIRMTYSPPGGVFGHAVASLFGADPKREMDDDLVRLKSLLEYGKTRAHGETVWREDVNV